MRRRHAPAGPLREPVVVALKSKEAVRPRAQSGSAIRTPAVGRVAAPTTTRGACAAPQEKAVARRGAAAAAGGPAAVPVAGRAPSCAASTTGSVRLSAAGMAPVRFSGMWQSRWDRPIGCRPTSRSPASPRLHPRASPASAWAPHTRAAVQRSPPTRKLFWRCHDNASKNSRRRHTLAWGEASPQRFLAECPHEPDRTADNSVMAAVTASIRDRQRRQESS